MENHREVVGLRLGLLPGPCIADNFPFLFDRRLKLWSSKNCLKIKHKFLITLINHYLVICLIAEREQTTLLVGEMHP
jgi:hypothetical protein